jgi:hypothetical protein
MDIVQAQVDAYNSRDIDKFLAYYAPDIVVEDGKGRVTMRGLEQVRARYSRLFDNSPDLHCRILARLGVGSYVVDEEQVTGFNLEGTSGEMHAIVIYRVAGGKIEYVRVLR